MCNAFSFSICLHKDLCRVVGSLQPGQIEILVIVTTTATYSEELAACFEDAQDDQALDPLYNICFKTVRSIKPVTSSQANKEENYWLALGRLSTALQTALKALPGGHELLEQILDPLKLDNGFEKSAQFANGAHQASRIQFWEMVVAHVVSIEEALQGCSSATQA